jgi:hypothetical protein
MSDNERLESIRKMEELIKKPISEKEAREFLYNIGVINKKNTLTKNYENLCIPISQA